LLNPATVVAAMSAYADLVAANSKLVDANLLRLRQVYERLMTTARLSGEETSWRQSD